MGIWVARWKASFSSYHSHAWLEFRSYSDIYIYNYIYVYNYSVIQGPIWAIYIIYLTGWHGHTASHNWTSKHSKHLVCGSLARAGSAFEEVLWALCSTVLMSRQVMTSLAVATSGLGVFTVHCFLLLFFPDAASKARCFEAYTRHIIFNIWTPNPVWQAIMAMVSAQPFKVWSTKLLVCMARYIKGTFRKTGVTKWGWRTCYSHPLLPLAQVRPHLRSLSFLLVGGRVSFRWKASCVCPNGWIRWLCSIAMSFKNFRCRFKSSLRKNRLPCVMATVAARCVVTKFCQGVLCNIFLDSTFYSEVLACGPTAWDLLEGIGSQFPYSKWMSWWTFQFGYFLDIIRCQARLESKGPKVWREVMASHGQFVFFLW